MLKILDIAFTAMLLILFMFCLTVTSSIAVKLVTSTNNFDLTPKNYNRFDNKL